MNPFLWVLTVLGGILGIVLLILAIVLFGNTRLILQYKDQKLKIWIGLLFLKYRIYPGKKKEKEKEEKDKEPAPAELRKHAAKQPPKKTEKSKPKKSGIKKVLGDMKLRDYVSVLQILVTKLVPQFTCRAFILHASVGGSEAMAIAMEYGTINALLYPILGAVSAAGKLKKCDVQITPDFTSEETKAEGQIELNIRLFRSIGVIRELIEKL